MEPRATAPVETSKHEDHQAFRVWGHAPVYLEDPLPWKCLAAFVYLLESLDYIAYCQDRGHDVVFQSPADVKEIKATDRRVVWKPDAASAHTRQQTTMEL